MYAKLFGRITESSLMEQDIPTRYAFVMLLAIADRTGHVIGTDVAIARRLNMPLDDFRRAVEVLSSPDCDSNSQEEEGRRLVRSDGERGYRLVNYVSYRSIRDEEGRRDWMRKYMRRYRDGKRSVNSGKPCKPRLAHADADADADASIAAGVPAAPPAEAPATAADVPQASAQEPPGVAMIVELYRRLHPNSRPGPKERRLIAARLREGFSVEQIGRAIEGQHSSPWHRGEDPRSDGTRYLQLELVVRSSAKLNQFLALADQFAGGGAASAAESPAKVGRDVADRVNRARSDRAPETSGGSAAAEIVQHAAGEARPRSTPRVRQEQSA